jgi:hypothetical protein
MLELMKDSTRPELCYARSIALRLSAHISTHINNTVISKRDGRPEVGFWIKMLQLHSGRSGQWQLGSLGW